MLQKMKNLHSFPTPIYLFLALLLSFNLNALNDSTKEYIKYLTTNSNQLSVAEYTLIASTLTNKSPCNMLVFGVGRDSILWIENNQGGKTVFLEDNIDWFNRISGEVPQIDAHLIEYNTKRKEWKYWLEGDKTNELLLNLPKEIVNTDWEIIFVDGPEGWADDKPGRMRSIFTAAYLAKKSKECHVFVHDCDRLVEATYSSLFLLEKNLVTQFDRLRHYFVSR